MNPVCLLCFQHLQQGISLSAYVTSVDCICGLCRKRFEVCDTLCEVEGMHIHALYVYNDFFEDVMFTFKEQKDVALAPLFLSPFLKTLQKRYKGYTVLFAPSSKEKEQERGFVTLALLYRALKLESRSLFYKCKDYKQSNQPYLKRHQIAQVLALNKQELPQTKLLLVDDMCTSGATLKAMYQLVKSHPYPIAMLTIGIHKQLFEVARKR